MRDLEDEARIKAYMEAKMKHIKMYNECMNLADGLDVEKFAELVRADEREACAKVCLEGTDMPVQVDALKIIRAERDRIVNAIRARGNDLQTTIGRGTKAWADVPDATKWVEELRGNDTTEVPKREWVGLTKEDFYKKDDETVFVLGMKFAEARLKEKNA